MKSANEEEIEYPRRDDERLQLLRVGQACQNIVTAPELTASSRTMTADKKEWQQLNADLEVARGLTRESEDRLQAIMRAAAIGTFDLSPATGELVWDDRCRELFGVAPGEPVTYDGTFLAQLHPEDRATAQAAVEQALVPGGSGTFDIEYRTIGRDDGKLRWVAAAGSRVQLKAGEHFVGTVRDVTGRRLAEQAQQEIAERYRLASRATNDAIWDWDLVKNQVLWNEALYKVYGHSPDTVEESGEWWLEQVHPADRDQVSTTIYAVIDGRDARWTHEYRFRRADDTYALVQDRGYVLRDQAGRAIRMVGAMLDLSERQRAQDHQRMLLNELQHRVKNTLAITRAIAVQTFKDAPAVAREAFAQRLIALSHANEIITATNWQAAPITDVVAAATIPYSADERIIARGPGLMIAARSAVSMTLALHELCTNAMKYGALSVEGGIVEINWGVAADGFWLIWEERNGPAVTKPLKAGFGSRLIQRSLGSHAGAAVDLDFNPAGLRCSFRAPLTAIVEQSNADEPV